MSTYNISKSSLLSLKAEILRKQEELGKVKKDNTVKIQNLKKKTPLDLKNSGIEQREAKDVNSDDEDLLRKSRLALEAKSKLYDKLSKEAGNLSEEQTETDRQYLVCFNKKVPENNKAENEDIHVDSDEDNNYAEDYAPATNPDEEWVEYTDCLGRTRTCLRKDLEYLKSKDSELRRNIDVRQKDDVSSDKQREEESSNRSVYSEETNITEDNELLSSDMRREMLRRQWEKEEEALKDKSNIHYQDVLFSEARTHGVGYYGFSKDEEMRAQQQEALKKLRQETEQQQKKAQELRKLREKQLAARATAARNRKRARMGLPPEEEDPEVAKEAEQNEEPAPENPEPQKEKTKEEQKKELKRKQHVRPWDIGKEGVKKHYEYTQEEWVEKKRTERHSEFAPPTAYRKNFNSKMVPETLTNDADKTLYFSTKKQSTSQSTTRRNLNYYKESTEFVQTPIVNECEISPEPFHYEAQATTYSDDSDDEIRGKGVEIAPPPTIDYYGPSETKRAKTHHKKENLEESIAAGLKFLRKQAEQKEKPHKRDSEMFIM